MFVQEKADTMLNGSIFSLKTVKPFSQPLSVITFEKLYEVLNLIVLMHQANPREGKKENKSWLMKFFLSSNVSCFCV